MNPYQHLLDDPGPPRRTEAGRLMAAGIALAISVALFVAAVRTRKEADHG